MTFKQFVENSSLRLEGELQDNFVNFCDSLMMYISYNDDESSKDLLELEKVLNKAGIIENTKKVFKIVKCKESNLKDLEGLSSCSLIKLKGKTLEDMKDTVSDNSDEGDFWYCEYQNVEGININKLYSLFKGKKKNLIKKYDIEYNTIGALYDTFEDFKKQKEFIVYGKGILKNYERI